MAKIAQFVHANGTALGASVTNLAKVAAAIGRPAAELAQLLSVGPLTLQNVAQRLQRRHPRSGAPGAAPPATTRSAATAAFATSICGNSVLRLLVLAVDQSQDKIPTTDLSCGVAYACRPAGAARRVDRTEHDPAVSARRRPST